MKFQMRLRCQTIVVLYYVVLTLADQDVNSANVIPASPNNGPVLGRTSRVSQSFKPYAFRPRAIPLKTEKDTTPQPEQKNVYYTQDNKYKTEILFPGNYFAIPKEKSTVKVEDSAYNPLVGGQFEPKAIPLLRSQGFAKRSLDLEEEPIEKSEELDDQLSLRRSLSYILGEGEADEDDEDEDGEYEVEETDDVDGDGVESKHKVGGHFGHGHGGHKNKRKNKRGKRISKYMMPLLLAYKLKYLAIVPVMIGGLILLVGATGLAGFFFALFAGVMGLQKGGY